MARITDLQKIENVKRAAMEIITENGYKSASIAFIAQKAGVSVGYLYRYYKSKDDLIRDIIHNYFQEVLHYFLQSFKNCKTVSEIFYSIVMTIFQLAKSDPSQAKFVVVLLLELDADVMIHDSNYIALDGILDRIHSISAKTKEISSKVTKEEIEVVITSIPTRYLLYQLKKKNYLEMIDEECAKRISELCLKALS